MNSFKEIIKRFEYIKSKAESYNAKVVVVTKNIPSSMVRILYDASHRDFGENRVQEWLSKKAELPQDINWHIIGPLQSNKVKKVTGKVFLIHSVDREKILELIDRSASSLNVVVDCLLEVHLAREETKHGFSAQEILSLFERKRPVSESYKNVRILGLMTMASFTDDRKQIRNEFKALRELGEQIKSMYGVPSYFSHLSMGMSNDWEIALEEGATIIRVGTAIWRG